MTTKTLFAAAAAFVLLALTPASAADMTATPRHHHYRHAHWWGLPYHISYLHNYGPGPAAGTFAYYDGPTSVKCYQSAAAYRGQDGRRHPCF
ncbi:hypothetical protein JQ604_15845 [Bradyrhizobium jicamae]|uniref:hypothetical protein n=1 Tax=Bradyrhizobium jicamae TaxID=280332 RepID=UPI001BA4A3AF|nr:hypothetical protein [Bradyrhizobium jicamae]MBR0753661.1 hypothetical protein [Bradyrhizobium jicamae]